MDKEALLSQVSEDELRQFAHDIKAHLFVVSMGLESLKGVRNDDLEFEDVLNTIRRDGVEPLNQAVNDLLKLASARRPR